MSLIVNDRLAAGPRSHCLPGTDFTECRSAVTQSAGAQLSLLLADRAGSIYIVSMILIRFADNDLKLRALGVLAGRFPFKSWSTGEMIVPETALSFLAVEGIAFNVEGPATYEQSTPAIRAAATAAVQYHV